MTPATSEELLRRERDFSASLFETVGALVVVLDPAGRIVRFNRACEEATGWRAEEVLGRCIWDFLLPAEDIPAVRGVFSRLAAGEVRSRHENAWLTRRGERRWISWSNAALLASDGRVEFVVGTGLDQTLRRQALDRICEAEGELRLLIDSVPVLLAHLDRESRYLRVNRAYEEWFGFRREEIEGKHVREVLGEAAFQAIRGRIEEVLAGRTVTFESEVPYRAGGTRWVQASYIPDRGPRGEVRGWIGLVADVTERKRAELKLRESEARERARAEELERFSYTIAHDLRAPLRAMHGFSDLLLQEHEIDPAGRRHLEKIQAAAHRMDALIGDLLDYGRLGRTPARPEAVDPAEILRQEGRVDLELPLPPLRADRELLAQVLEQILSNALKFVAPGTPPRVRIRGSVAGDRARIRVDDNGIGIDPAYAEKVFGVFERLHLAEDYPGTGIGLAIVRRATTLMGGSAGFEPRPEGGTSFWIELPAAQSRTPS